MVMVVLMVIVMVLVMVMVIVLEEFESSIIIICFVIGRLGLVLVGLNWFLYFIPVQKKYHCYCYYILVG